MVTLSGAQACFPDPSTSPLRVDLADRVRSLEKLHSPRHQARQFPDGPWQAGQSCVHHRLWPGQEVPRPQDAPAHPLQVRPAHCPPTLQGRHSAKTLSGASCHCELDYTTFLHIEGAMSQSPGKTWQLLVVMLGSYPCMCSDCHCKSCRRSELADLAPHHANLEYPGRWSEYL